jgi:hypothetical protein
MQRRHGMKWGATAVVAFLAGCAQIGLVPNTPETPVPWRAIALSEVWVRQPEATFALGRDRGDSADQLIGLANETIVEGDNVLVLRGHRSGSTIGLVPRLAEFMELAQGRTAPFEGDVEGRLLQAADAAGLYNWAETTGRAGARCVLAMRRIDGADALLPSEFIALDAVLRNCVAGRDADPLAPLSVTQLGTANAGPPIETNRTLSHLAGPRRAGP